MIQSLFLGRDGGTDFFDSQSVSKRQVKMFGPLPFNWTTFTHTLIFAWEHDNFAWLLTLGHMKETEKVTWLEIQRESWNPLISGQETLRPRKTVRAVLPYMSTNLYTLGLGLHKQFDRFFYLVSYLIIIYLFCGIQVSICNFRLCLSSLLPAATF